MTIMIAIIITIMKYIIKTQKVITVIVAIIIIMKVLVMIIVIEVYDWSYVLAIQSFLN